METGDSQPRNFVETRFAPCACTGLGKVERISMAYAPGTAEANKVWTVYQYDALGRTLSYGNLQEIYSYATGGQIATKTLRYSASGHSADLVATYTWSSGRLASARPPNGDLFNYSYKSMGLPTGMQRVRSDNSTEDLFSGGVYDFAARLSSLQFSRYSLAETRILRHQGPPAIERQPLPLREAASSEQ